MNDPYIQCYCALDEEENFTPLTSEQNQPHNSLQMIFTAALEQTNEDASNPEPLATDDQLPVTSISGVWSEDEENYGAKYDPTTDTFRTKVYIQFLFEADKRPEAGKTYTYTNP